MTTIEATLNGAVVEVLDADTARELLAGIQVDLADIHDLVDQLYAGKGWIALDYGSWDALVAAEIHPRLPKLTQSERAAMVTKLTDTGMSNRAIAGTLGVNRRTVARDQVEHSAPPESVMGMDGKTYKRPENPHRGGPKPAPTVEEQEDTARRQRQARVFQHAEAIYSLLARLAEEGVDDEVRNVLVGINNTITQTLKGES